MGEQTQILTDLASGAGRALLPTDDDRHPADPADPFWAETSWWVFMNPVDRLGGWIYLLTRPNLGMAALAVWLWDDGTGLEPWRLRYSKSFVHVPLPEGYSLRDLRLSTHGFHLQSIEALSNYRLTFDDGSLSFDLEFAAVHPPQGLGVGATTGHFDQPMWGTGSVTLNGRSHTIDAPSFRDRTWSTRPETAVERANCYSWATGRELSFQLLAMLGADDEPLFAGGYLHRDGGSAPLTAVVRQVVERDPVSHAPRRIEVDLTDQLGRSAHAVGRCITTAALPGFAGYLTFASMMDWSIDGVQVWGEDHDSWPHSTFVSRFG